LIQLEILEVKFISNFIQQGCSKREILGLFPSNTNKHIHRDDVPWSGRCAFHQNVAAGVCSFFFLRLFIMVTEMNHFHKLKDSNKITCFSQTQQYFIIYFNLLATEMTETCRQ